uniref:Uncharacterized protein n=1 Tax=viral metagenome TaxID=1070528 RepID=A0A6C0H5Q3_9ZZZZ
MGENYLNSYTFTTSLKETYETIKNELDLDQSIEKWIIKDDIVYNEDYVNDFITTYKLQKYEDFRHKNKTNVNKALHTNDSIMDINWDNRHLENEFDHIKKIEIFNEQLKKKEEIVNNNIKYENYYKKCQEFIIKSKLILVEKLNPTHLMKTQNLSNFLEEFLLVKLKNLYQYKQREIISSSKWFNLQLDGLNYDKKHDIEENIKKSKKLVTQLCYLLYYVPKTKELMNNIMMLNFTGNYETQWYYKSMRNKFKYQSESYLTRLYYFTGMTFNWSGWFSYLYEKASLDLNYISFLRKKYNVGKDDFDELDFVDFITNGELNEGQLFFENKNPCWTKMEIK